MKCKVCNEDFESSELLSRHINSKHKDLKTKNYYIKYISKGEHICPICGKQNKFKGLTKGFSIYCSDECSKSSKAKDLKVLKYSKTCLEKYGVDNYTKTDECIDKMKETNLKRYNVESYTQTKECHDKMKETCLENYGVDNYSKTYECKEKVKATNIKKYEVEYYSKTEESKERIKETCLEKYGVDNYSKTKEYKLKSEYTRRNNYWDRYKLLLKNKKIEVLFDKNFYINNEKNFKFKCLKCNKEFSIDEYKNPQNIYCKSCCNSISKEETEVLDFIKSIYKGSIESNKRFILNDIDKDIYNKKSLEADILIEEHKLIIEYDGIYWHSELFKENDYHLNKTEYFKSIGYDIIHIFSTEWNDKQDIVKSIIKNRLGLNTNRIYARKCELKEISNKEYNLFLDENHIQGNINSSIKIGLYYENELVSCIGVGKSRFTSSYELYRMVNKKYTSVVGGFSKLLKYLLTVNNIKELETYCDRRYFNGNGYKTVGFQFESYTKPAYYYIKGIKLYNRMNFMKHKLEEKLSVFDESKTEHENMLMNGYTRIYDCGNIKYKMIYNI